MKLNVCCPFADGHPGKLINQSFVHQRISKLHEVVHLLYYALCMFLLLQFLICILHYRSCWNSILSFAIVAKKKDGYATHTIKQKVDSTIVGGVSKASTP